MRLSIITPYFDRLKQLKELAKVLEPQLTNEVEWIIIDDGCNEKELDSLKANIIHLEENSGGASIPRNVGLDNAKGDYVAFIDSDDLIREDYVSMILEKTKEEWDYCYISWKTTYSKIIIRDIPPAWNCCVWNCIYKKDIIGEERFNPIYKMAEDYDFNQRVRKGNKSNILDILYYYNETTPNSLTKQGALYNKKYKE